MNKYCKVVQESDTQKGAARLSKRNANPNHSSEATDDTAPLKSESGEETTVTKSENENVSPNNNNSVPPNDEEDEEDWLGEEEDSALEGEQLLRQHIDADHLLSNEHLAPVDPVVKPVYSCDLCHHKLFPSHAQLERHALDFHGGEIGSDFENLRQVCRSVVPHWKSGNLQKRMREKNTQWGKKAFDTFSSRDGGEAKLKEAHAARQQLQHLVSVWNPTAEVFMFGSSVAFGVWDGVADIDFAVVDVAQLSKGLWPPLEKLAVRHLTELLRRVGFSFYNLEPIAHARVPILKHQASTPIQVPEAWRRSAREDIARLHGEAVTEPVTQPEAELLLARGVKVQLSAPVGPLDRLLVEACVRQHVGGEHVLQLWWNRTSTQCFMICSSTSKAMEATTTTFLLSEGDKTARVTPLHEECRPELFNVDFDLSFRSFGIRNSLLLRRYLTSHPCARPGAMILKDWSKTSKVNNSMHGYLTSYAINILWIYYLVQQKVIPYVDPRKDITEELKGEGSCPLDPPYVPLFSDPNKEKAADYHAMLGELLMGFFLFYAVEFDWEHHVVSLNRPGRTTKRLLGWEREDLATQPNGKGAHTRYSFCIEDPYEHNLNLGRHMGALKTLRVQREFHRGLISLMKDDFNDSCVFPSSRKTEQESEEPFTLEKALRAMGEKKDSLTGMDRLLNKEVCTGVTQASGAITPQAKNNPLCTRALYALMCIVLDELTALRQKEMEKDDKKESVGIPEDTLRQVMEQKAPLSLQLVSRVWSWQQLIHRLGFVVRRDPQQNRNVVGFRREIGLQYRHKHLTTEEQQQEENYPQSANEIADHDRLFQRQPGWVAWTLPQTRHHSVPASAGPLASSRPRLAPYRLVPRASTALRALKPSFYI